MPVIDLPLDELKTYRGRSPKPVDFDAYWERALAEMRAVKPDVRLEKAGFQTSFATCYELTFTGVRGARISAKYIRPKTVDSGRAVIDFHGYSINNGDWTPKLGYAAEGVSYIAMDVRGQGGKSEDTGGVKGPTLRGQIIRGLDDHEDNLLFRHIFLDAAQLAGILLDDAQFGIDELMATGWSQGGGLTFACAALEPRITRLASVYPFLTDYRRVWEMDLDVGAYEELRRFFRSFDPLHEREEAIFTRLGYIDVQHLAERIRGNTLMATGLIDTICPPSTQFAAYNRIQSAKELVVYPDFEHENLPGLPDRIFQFLTAP
ncbi:acetylxylan esterase [Salisediminibacterium selenitireducens]|uniref:Acetyl xylan esterase n=1 Tax=Bacillus selenitireducens (strain ATCC 700615 / DSM 15326 / MLS10) TaxID=439292 RepID=D6Y0B0_BACIE|nr:acetylxylan esterase [Salisediminibacterium selenitireducens]ADH98501.1 Acetyl xylan esterase [[Bacillus] selenitireducens MLS10]